MSLPVVQKGGAAKAARPFVGILLEMAYPGQGVCDLLSASQGRIGRISKLARISQVVVEQFYNSSAIGKGGHV
jgi:hypothetical protein